MNEDPESTPGDPVPAADTPAPAGSGPEIPVATAQAYSWPAPQEPLAKMQSPEFPAFDGLQSIPAPPPPPSRLIPNIGHFFVFLGLLVPAAIGGYIVALGSLLAAQPHVNFRVLMARMAHSVLYAISFQAAIYVVLWGLTVLVFSLWWGGFWKGIHWNGAVARRRFVLLAAMGVATGLLITIAGNFVPMPKAPPILEDLTRSRLGAWFLMGFGVTLAPLTEELAFRGFLLPSFINIFRWFERQRKIGESVVNALGIPLSIVLTSVPFALMHSEQVANSWGPVLLIGLVSVVLCIVRLSMKSLASSILVHSFYNLTLFTGLLIQTDGFRHLDKLKG